MSEVTARGFVELLNKSGLIEKDRLKSVLKDIARQSDGQTITIDQLTGYLLDNDLISEWHCKKLLAGRHKGFFLGKYKLIRHLGTGGMSSVYLAENTLFSQKRAIKVLPKSRISDKTYLERFYREGRAAASLNHKNVVRVYDIDNEGDTHYLVMEFVEGRDIYDMVKQDGPLDYNTAIDYTIQTLTGLMHAHETDLVHRDIKPANLLVTPDGTVKILDLGLALFQEEDTSLTVMHNERVLGTADYLSPEQAVDSHNVDHRSDIYSTGCSLYYMLTGKPPFHEGTLAQRIAMHQVREPQSVLDFRPDCPPPLVAVLKKMMAKKPDQRFQDCEETITALRQVSEQLFSDSNRTTESTRTTPPPRNREGEKAKLDKKSASVPARKSSAGRKKTAARPPAAQPAASARAAGDKPRGPAKRPAKPAAQTVQQPAAKKAARQPAKQKPAKPDTPSGKKPSAPVKGMDRKDYVEASSVSVVVPDNNQQSAGSTVIVDDQQLRQFVKHSGGERTSATARVKRRPVKNQLIIAGMVAGMLVLLGLTMLLAMFLTSPSNEDTNESGSRPNPPVLMAAAEPGKQSPTSPA